MFTIVNPPHLKQIQTNQREELTDIRKSDMEIQCVKPQIQDHSNKVPELSFRQFTFSAPGGIRYLKYRTPEEFIQVTCYIMSTQYGMQFKGTNNVQVYIHKSSHPSLSIILENKK